MRFINSAPNLIFISHDDIEGGYAPVISMGWHYKVDGFWYGPFDDTSDAEGHYQTYFTK